MKCLSMQNLSRPENRVNVDVEELVLLAAADVPVHVLELVEAQGRGAAGVLPETSSYTLYMCTVTPRARACTPPSWR